MHQWQRTAADADASTRARTIAHARCGDGHGQSHTATVMRRDVAHSSDASATPEKHAAIATGQRRAEYIETDRKQGTASHP
jgi:hypothetical protein